MKLAPAFALAVATLAVGVGIADYRLRSQQKTPEEQVAAACTTYNNGADCDAQKLELMKAVAGSKIYQPEAAPTDAAKTEPTAPSLQGFWMVYNEVAKKSDLEYNRKLESSDGKRVYSVAIAPGKQFTDMPYESLEAQKQRNKALMDYMAECVGTDNTRTLAQMAEGSIVVYTTTFSLGKTIEITHLDPGQKNYVRDASFNCKDTQQADAAVAMLKRNLPGFGS
jgi:hypothetical protein